jgi:hypothetical protein
MVHNPAPLRWLAILLLPAGLFGIGGGLYDLADDGANIGGVTIALVIAAGALLLWCGVAFVRRRQHWWHYLATLVGLIASGPLDDRVMGEPLRLRPSWGVVLAVLVTAYAAVRAARSRGPAAQLQPEPPRAHVSG